MPKTKQRSVESFFEAFGAGELDAALALATRDLVLDQSNSKGPVRGITRGQAEVRVAYRDFLDPIEGMAWEPKRMRALGAELVAVETEISTQGRSSGISAVAHGGWLVRFEGELIAEGALHQSYEQALLAGRRRCLADARLYFVCEAKPGGRDPAPLLEAAIAGGVDVIQLREKAPRCAEELVAFSQPFARVARERGALFFLNDRPDLIAACDADGVHVGQNDEPVAAARAVAGASALVGLSTHSRQQFDAALVAQGAGRPDQLSAGPVWETPTKPRRPAAGLALIEHAARTAGAEVAWFAIGGIDAGNVAEVAAAGARRIVAVRAIRDAPDPESAARELRAALDP